MDYTQRSYHPYLNKMQTMEDPKIVQTYFRNGPSKGVKGLARYGSGLRRLHISVTELSKAYLAWQLRHK